METDNGKGIEMHTIDFVNNSISILDVNLKDIKMSYGKIMYLVIACVTVGCSVQKEEVLKVGDNQELIEMLVADQEVRNDENANYEPTDLRHRRRIFELLADNKIVTNSDKFNAALILQHTGVIYCNDVLKSNSAENFLLAYSLSNSAYNSGFQKAANLVAANYDRYLLFTKGYQKYGTQKVYDEKSDSFLWAPIDSLTTDAERAKYSLPKIEELLKQAKMKKFVN